MDPTDANENLPKEALMAVKHIELVAPLLPPGKLAVVIEGSPLFISHQSIESCD